MFLGSPRCFVIVKNLKRNRQDKNRIPAHKSIFHPAAWEAAASEWAPGCLHLCVRAPQPCDPSGGGEGVPSGAWAPTGSLTSGRPPAPPLGREVGH